jgi:hypothetical protein
MPTTVDQVADATVKALAAGRQVVWVPGVLRLAFVVFRHLPRALWRKLPA